MDRRGPAACLAVVFATGLLFYSACETAEQKEERVARLNCSACHAFPDPSLLDRKTWEESVLPHMAFRMGSIDSKVLGTIDPREMDIVLGSLPPAPMTTESDWELIRKYYTQRSPDSLTVAHRTIVDTLQLFDPIPLDKIIEPYVTLLHVDPTNHKLYAGTRLSNLFTFDASLNKTDSLSIQSPPSWMMSDGDDFLITEMGFMDPNDLPAGKLVRLSNRNSIITEVDSLKRPVHFSRKDLNNDLKDDYVVCAFGNYTGFLAVYEKRDSGWSKHLLSRTPGARKTIVRDFDRDGRPDILALFSQGDERLVLYTNKGEFNFESTTLLRFSPVNGTSYFELADFNNDGHPDILVTNGDNADYSMVVKPYHAVKIYENDGDNNFSEKWSFAMPGASMAMACDFDMDGDLDLAAISFFPDFKKAPERSFLYFENNGDYSFTPRVTSYATRGRWLVMEAADYDDDGDVDIILGANNFRGLGSTLDQYRAWAENQTSILVFKNRLISR